MRGSLMSLVMLTIWMSGAPLASERLEFAEPLTPPEYPPSSRRQGEQGTAVISVFVGVSGELIDAKVGKSSGYPTLDEKALRHIKNTARFKPVDAPLTDEIPIVFKLTEPPTVDPEKLSVLQQRLADANARYTDEHPEVQWFKREIESLGGNPVPAMRIDIHVYGDRPSDNFVFINMRRYTEGQVTTEGPVLESVTPNGVMLNYQGARWEVSKPRGPVVSRGRVSLGQGTYSGPLLDGIPHGFGEFDSGTGFTESGEFVNGKRQGVFKTFDNGVLDEIATYEKGVRHGPFATFATRTRTSSSYTAGIIGLRLGDKRSQGTYENGKLEGELYTFARSNDSLSAVTRRVYSAGEITHSEDLGGVRITDVAQSLLSVWQQSQSRNSATAISGSPSGKSMAAPGSATATSSSSPGGSACPSSLSHLASQLPAYGDSDLRQLRSAILQTDLREAMRTAQSQGYSPQQAAAATLQQARAADQTLKSAEACVHSAAHDGNALLEQLRRGSFEFNRGSISHDCARGYVAAYYAAVANRESAVGLACLAR